MITRPSEGVRRGERPAAVVVGAQWAAAGLMTALALSGISGRLLLLVVPGVLLAIRTAWVHGVDRAAWAFVVALVGCALVASLWPDPPLCRTTDAGTICNQPGVPAWWLPLVVPLGAACLAVLVGRLLRSAR